MRRFFIIGAILAGTVLFVLPTNARAAEWVVEIKQDAQTGEIKEVSQVIDAQGGRVREVRMSQGEFDQKYGGIAEYAGTITILKFTKPNPGNNCTTYCSGGWCDTFCW